MRKSEGVSNNTVKRLKDKHIKRYMLEFNCIQLFVSLVLVEPHQFGTHTVTCCKYWSKLAVKCYK